MELGVISLSDLTADPHPGSAGRALDRPTTVPASRSGRLMRHGQLAAAGTADPLFGPVVDESLRLRPVAMGAMRRLTRPVSLAGHHLQAARC